VRFEVGSFRATVVMLSGLFGYAVFLRPRLVRWRATDDELARRMLGDEQIEHPLTNTNRAITVEAPVEDVWPWLAQMGSLRGGWYSYDWVDNGGRPSADRVLEQYQQVQPGDVLPCLPGASDAFLVTAVTPPRDLILTVPGAAGPITSWEHFIEPLGSVHSRLIVRGRVARLWKQMAREAHTAGQRTTPIEYVYRLIGRLPDTWLSAVTALGHRWMEARHMRGIKRRVESMGRAA